jgi:hypothetical protein
MLGKYKRRKADDKKEVQEEAFKNYKLHTEVCISSPV